MSALVRAGLLHRIRSRLTRRNSEHSVRASIAELVQEAAQEPQLPGRVPELDRQEQALIANVLRLRGTTADDVMVPRADIVAMHLDVSLDEAVAQIRREGHSRMPVYREQLDDVVGMVHVVSGGISFPNAHEFRCQSRVGSMLAGPTPAQKSCTRPSAMSPFTCTNWEQSVEEKARMYAVW